MTLTIFLARLIGFYCVVVTLAMLLRWREAVATITAIINDPGAMMMSGVIALAGGLAVILGHNIWHGGWLAIAVTCIGWGMVAKGAKLLLLSNAQIKSYYKSLHYERFFTLYMGVTLLLGLALLWGSFS